MNMLDEIFNEIKELAYNGFSGDITISFYQGNVSKNVKIKNEIDFSKRSDIEFYKEYCKELKKR